MNSIVSQRKRIGARGLNSSGILHVAGSFDKMIFPE